MNTPISNIPQVYMAKGKTNPIVIAAAVSLILFSVVGIGVMTGLIPTANSKTDPKGATTVSAPAPKSAGAPRADSKPSLAKATVAESAPVAASKSARSTDAVDKNSEPLLCEQCGVVQSVRAVQNKGEASGLGAIAGGITGAVVGNRVGEGQGKTLATMVGVVGGAVAGNKIEENMKKTQGVSVTLLMDSGAARTLRLSTDPGVLPGDKVKVVNGALVRR